MKNKVCLRQYDSKKECARYPDAELCLLHIKPGDAGSKHYRESQAPREKESFAC